MEQLKFRVFYDRELGEDDTIYLGIDTFENIEERSKKEDKYLLAMDIGRPGYLRLNQQLRKNNILILKTDVTRAPKLSEYMIMNEALRKGNFKFNRKTGELVYTQLKKETI